MGFQSVLAMKRSNGTAGAYRLVGATSSQIGANFGTIDSTSTATQRAQNNIIQFSSTPSITGTVAVTNGSAAVVGTGTTFTTACPAGSKIMFANQPNVVYTVSSVTDNTHLTLTANFTGVTNASTALQVIILLLAWIRNEIYSYDGSRWTVRLTLSGNVLTGNNVYSGLWLVEINGTPTIIGYFTGSTGNAGITTTDGFTWTNTTLTGGINPSNMLACTTFKNVLYMGMDSGAIGSLVWDPTGTALVATNPTGMVGIGHDFAAFKGNLYKIAPDSTGTPGYWLWVFNAGVWTHVVQLPQTGNASPNTPAGTGQPVMFAPGDGFLYAIYQTFTTTGTKWAWLCCKLDVTGLTGTATDISSTVLPAGYAYGTAPTLSLAAQWRVIVECESNPTSPTVHLWTGSASTNVTWSHYLWNGNASLIGSGGIPDDTGGDVSMAIPMMHEGSGEVIWVPSDFDVRITATLSIANGQQLNFIVVGLLGTESKSVAFYFNNTNLEIPKVQCTIATPGVVSGPASVPTLSGSQLNGVTADGETGAPTTYSIQWQASADGVANQAAVKIVPRVF